MQFYDVCPKCDRERKGDEIKCPECGMCLGRVMTFSRVTGFIQPIQLYNRGKREEYRQRVVYDIDNEGDKKL